MAVPATLKTCNGCRNLVLVLAALGIAGPLGSEPSFAKEQVIEIGNFAFSPEQITVPIGTTVTFRNGDDMVHTVVAENGSFRSKALDTDDAFSFTFTAAGDYAYVCGLHPFMHGKVTVTP